MSGRSSLPTEWRRWPADKMHQASTLERGLVMVYLRSTLKRTHWLRHWTSRSQGGKKKQFDHISIDTGAPFFFTFPERPQTRPASDVPCRMSRSSTWFRPTCWLLTEDLTDSEGFAHFRIRICLGTKPVSCLLVFFILFSLRIFAFPKKCTWFRRLVSQFMCTQRVTLMPLTKLLPRVKYRCFIRVLSCIAFSLQFLASNKMKK